MMSTGIQLFAKGLLFALMTFAYLNSAFAQITASITKVKGRDITLKQFCTANKRPLKRFFSEINTSYPGLGKVEKALSRNNYVEACEALLSYYQHKPVQSDVMLGVAPNVVSKTARDAADLKFTFQGISGSLPASESGHLDWLYKGPNSDVEWSYFLNRMWYLDSLQLAHRASNDIRFATAFQLLITDWIFSNPAPKENANDAAWRVLEAGLRMAGPWPKAFYGFQRADQFTSVARLLMLMSIVDHAHYLQKYHWTHHNHGVMELNGLTNVALSFPEFKSSHAWYQHALKAMAEEFDYQRYPDGAMKELSSSYQWVVIRHFNEFIQLHELHQKELPDNFYETVQLMCNYMAYTSRPDGYGMLNNDADLLNNFKILQTYVKYRRPEWKYILSNGKDGRRPDTTSIMFPWAGHFIMRNGWGESVNKSDYAFFDAGPWGTSHQHNDKLHLSVFFGGRELLCDAGRMYYKVDKWRKFFNLSASHNVVLLDGKGQDDSEPESNSPIPSNTYRIQEDFDFCIGTYEGGFNDINQHVETSGPETVKAKHIRAVLYVKNKYWIVLDHIKADQPRSLTALWHFNPDCSVIANGSTVFTNDAGKANLSIKPLADIQWTVKLVKGQEEPFIQGWYSPRYNERIPSYCAEFTWPKPTEEATFAWLMTPTGDTAIVHPEAKLIPSIPGTIHLKIKSGNDEVEIAIDFTGEESITLSDDTVLKGQCAVRTNGKTSVINGKILSKSGNVLVEDQ